VFILLIDSERQSDKSLLLSVKGRNSLKIRRGGLVTKHFRLKLFFIMITFAIILLFLVAFIDYIRLKEEAVKNHEFQITKTEEEVKYALQTIDKAYYLFDQETVTLLEDQTAELMDLYEEQPQFDKWDFQSLSEQYGVDIFIIDEHNVITHSNKKEDIGLDFTECCKTLEGILNERRDSGEFFIDDMDVEQSSGEIRRYSYMATDDKKYMIELGYSLEEGTIFEQFNFLSVIDDLIERFPTIEKINVLNIGGLSLGSLGEQLSAERKRAFDWTRSSKETTEVKSESTSTIYRYVHYETPVELETNQSKILEIIYDETDFQALLANHKHTFIAQFIIVLIVTIIISLLLSRWMAKPIYLAFHDSLTQLKNRAAFDEKLKDICTNYTEPSALLMLDIDNFKSVNDQLGHDQGDQFLKMFATVLDENFAKEADIYRVGGDEFAIVIQQASKEEVKQMGRRLRKTLTDVFANNRKLKELNVDVSVGISFTSQYGENPEIMYKAADLALYRSKYSQENKINICTEEVV